MNRNISSDRRKYLNKIRLNKWLVIGTQISFVIAFVILWEVLADKKVIDSFITSQPSRIWATITNLSRR